MSSNREVSFCTPKSSRVKQPFKSPLQTLVPSSNTPPVHKRNSELTMPESLLDVPSVCKKHIRSPFVSPLIKGNGGNSLEKVESKCLESLLKQEDELDLEISELEKEGYTLHQLHQYITALHDYNDIKDAAQVVMGQIAELEQVSIAHIHKRYNIEDIG